MLNTIRMEWYHLTKMKSFYVILLMTVVLSILTNYANYLAYKELINSNAVETEHENPSSGSGPHVISVDESSSEEESTQLIVGITPMLPDGAILKNPLEANDFLVSNICSCTYLVMLVILTGLYTASDFKSGYIKNIIGSNSHRFVLVISKMIIMFVNAFLVFTVTVLTQIATLFILYKHMVIVTPVKLLGLLAVQFLLHYAFILIVMLVVYLTRSGSIGYLFGLLGITNILAIPLSGINLLIQKYVNGAEDFMIFHYLVRGNLNYITSTASAAVVQRAVIVAIIFGCIAVAGSIGIFTKRDIR